MQSNLAARLIAIYDLSVPQARNSAGRHEYDGRIAELSPAGIRTRITRLGGPSYPDPHDEAQVTAAEQAIRVRFGELELHRVNPIWHLENLELIDYEREYAPEPDRRAARRAHLALWPDAVAAAIEALDRVPAPVARSTIGLARGLLAHLRPEDGEVGARGLAAIEGLVAHLEHAATHGVPTGALGRDAFTRLLSATEAYEIDIDDLAKRADAERDRMWQLLEESCRRVDPTAPPATTVRRLKADHPTVDGALAEATALVNEAIAWTARNDLVPYTDGECRVGLMPESQRRALAGMFWAAPGEPDSPSWFRITPPDPSWPAEEQESWLANGFNPMVLPNIAIHEVAPGHFAHGRALRHAGSEVRRTLQSESFIEGWAHYCEEMALEQGFRDGDPRHAIGVALDALRRVTRLACAIGVHTGVMTTADAAARFAVDALLEGPAAMAEANRAYFDPTYGCYTLGKLAILDLRERARAAWGPAFSLPRFHRALLELGAPALGLLDTALDRGRGWGMVGGENTGALNA